ncbi:MAG: SoxR reducing system RseC family protein [Rhodocyclales bacterium]|nr:SoxR reducing system RseC family protein [Rhodocyclales bacterium]
MPRSPTSSPAAPDHMVERILHVVKVDGGIAWAVPESGGACAACVSAARCGASGAASAQAIPTQSLPSASVGDRIVVGLESGALTEAALTAYAIPMTTMLVCAGAVGAWSHSDGLAAVAAAAGLALGMLIARLRGLRPSVRARFAPRVLRQVEPAARCAP